MNIELSNFQERFTKAFQDMSDECNQQDFKWGDNPHYNHVWLSILLKQIGQIADSINLHDYSELERQLVHAAAVLTQWISDSEREDK